MALTKVTNSMLATPANGFIKVRLADVSLTTLPLVAPLSIDQVVVASNDLVLFTNLSSGNNTIHKATVTGLVVSWALQSLYQGDSSTPSVQDFVTIKEGAYYALNDVGFNGTAFYNVLDNRVSQTLLDNKTDEIFLELDTAIYKNVSMDYSVHRGATSCRGGLFRAISNGATAAHVDDTSQQPAIGTTGVSFTSAMSGTILRIRYTTTSTGSDATMKRVIRMW